MSRQLFFISILFLTIELSFANNNDWDCVNGKEEGWSCGNTTGFKNTEKSTSQIIKNKPPKNKTVKPVFSSGSAQKKPAAVSTEPPKTTDKNVGWSCFTGDLDETWNCSLKGTDPKGKEKAIEDSKKPFSLFSDAFDFGQEQNFAVLQSRLAYDPWKNCGAASRIKPSYDLDENSRNTNPMNVTADYTEVFDKEITSFFGNVEISRADQKILSDRASYDTVSETMDAQGQVLYTENQISLFSDTALLNLKTNEARLRNALFISPAGPIRGSADVVYRDNKFLSRYKQVAFTSCRPGNQDWVIHAERLKMNKKTGKGAARNAWLEFKGVPFLYTPYISFPTDDRRMTGLLAPSFDFSGDNGFDLSIPYYWNIAPNYDFIFRPRYMVERGAMIGGEFRYLSEMTRGSIGIEYLPYDKKNKKHRSRFSGTFKNYTTFTPHLKSSIDYNYVSDDTYFEELNSTLGLANDRYLKSQANLNYSREGVAFITHFESYQTIDKIVKEEDEPYQKLPQIVLNLDHSFDDWPVDIAMDSEYVNFYREDIEIESGDGNLVKTKVVNGHRFNIKPSIAIPVKTPGYFIKPTISLQHTKYYLNNQKQGIANNLSRTLPIFSIDSGLTFEKDFEGLGSSYMHTIEPRLFYLYIPHKNQKDIPAFDSLLYDYSYASLFRENRFSGSDRVQDANQLTMAVTSRLINNKTGREHLKLSVGAISYFRDRKVTLTGKPETHDFSNLITELNGQISDKISFSSGLHWSPYKHGLVRWHAKLSYRDLPGKVFNLGYRYRGYDPKIDQSQQLIEELREIRRIDASFRWPLFDDWYGIGRWQYSFKENSTTESFLGLEKENCCWRFSFLWRRFSKNNLDNKLTIINNDDIEDEMDEGFFVQLELKGLTNFTNGFDNFLEEKLSGYERPE